MLLLAPDLANITFLVPAFVAELSLALWLLIKGVDASKVGNPHTERGRCIGKFVGHHRGKVS